MRSLSFKQLESFEAFDIETEFDVRWSGHIFHAANETFKCLFFFFLVLTPSVTFEYISPKQDYISDV